LSSSIWLCNLQVLNPHDNLVLSPDRAALDRARLNLNGFGGFMFVREPLLQSGKLPGSALLMLAGYWVPVKEVLARCLDSAETHPCSTGRLEYNPVFLGP